MLALLKSHPAVVHVYGNFRDSPSCSDQLHVVQLHTGSSNPNDLQSGRIGTRNANCHA